MDAQLVFIASGAVMLVSALAVAAVLLAARAGGRRQAGVAAAQAAALRSAFEDRLADKDRQIAELAAELRRVRGYAEQVQERLAATQRDHAVLQTGAEERARQHEQQMRELGAAREELAARFKALAGDIVRQESETFGRQNREQIDLLLKPLREKIAEFQQGLIADRASLIEQVKFLHGTSLGMQQEATSLSRALRGSVQMQGAWGEMILDTVLQSSGLRKGDHYLAQQPHVGEDGERLRTDVEILLPQGDRIVVDSKVSLLDYTDFVNAADEAARADSARRLVESMRRHIELLGGKDYHRHAGSGLDFVLMFVPIEGAFAAALATDPKLIEKALARQVCLTTPTTLMSTLRTVNNVWQVERRQRHAEEIADRAGKLYDKVAGFLDNMNRLEKSLDGARAAFTDARAQLAGGSGSVLRQIEMLKDLGAKSSKPLPAGWRSLPDDPTASPHPPNRQPEALPSLELPPTRLF